MRPAAPRFAVLLCTHNGAAFLREQLDSLVSQVLPPKLLFVHDWGSSDATRQIIEDYQADPSTNITWVVRTHAEAPGACRSFLSALQQCLGSGPDFDYLCFCDQDDVWHPEKLAAFAECIADRPALDLVYCDVALVDAAGRLLAETYLGPGGAFGRPMDTSSPAVLFVSTVCGMSMAVSRRLLLRGRTLWSSPAWVAHDWAMMIFAFLNEAPVAFVPRSLVRYRQHGGNQVGATGHQRLGLLAWFHAVSAHTALVQQQYRFCATLRLRQLDPAIGRMGVAMTILRGRSFRPLKTLKVALGYAALWRR